MLPEQQQRIMGYFIEEAKDHLNTIEQGLLNLQATIEDSEKANEVFRAAHSVKGGAAMLGLESIQTIAHRMEDYFKILKESSVQVDSTLETMFLRVSDGLKDLLEQLEGPFGLTPEKAQEIMSDVDPVFGQLEKHLNALVAAGGGMSTGATTPGSATADALQVSFKQEVSALLRQLLSTFKQTDTAESRRNLQEICAQLSTIGQQFELSAWCDLIETARLAAEETTNEYRVLAPVLIKEIKKSQDLVLSGRASEVGVSEAMQALLPEDLLAPAHPLPDDTTTENITTEEDLFADGLFDTEIDTDTEDLNELFGLDTANTVVSDGTAPEVSETVENADTTSELDFIETDDFEATQSNLNNTNHLQGSDSAPEAPPEAPAKRLDIDLDFNEIPSELSALNRNNDVEEKADESLDALLATVNVTGPDVGTEELNSLADLFDGDLEELDNTLGSHPFISEEMRLHPERIDLEEEEDITDFLADDSLTQASNEDSNTVQSDDLEDDLFGGTLTEGGFADINELNLDDALDDDELNDEALGLDTATDAAIDATVETATAEESSFDTELESLAEDPWTEGDDNDLEDLFGEGSKSLASEQPDLGITEPPAAETEQFQVDDESEAIAPSLEEGPLGETHTESAIASEVVSAESTEPVGNLSSGLFAVEPLSPSEHEIEFPTLTGVKLEEAEKDIDSFFFDSPIDESDDSLDDEDTDENSLNIALTINEEATQTASIENELSEDPWGELNIESTPLQTDSASEAPSDNGEESVEDELFGADITASELDISEDTETGLTEATQTLTENNSIDFDLLSSNGELTDNLIEEPALTDDLFDTDDSNMFGLGADTENTSLDLSELDLSDLSEPDQVSFPTGEDLPEEKNTSNDLWDDLSLSSEETTEDNSQDLFLGEAAADSETKELDIKEIELDTADIQTVFSAELGSEDAFDLDNFDLEAESDNIENDFLLEQSEGESAIEDLLSLDESFAANEQSAELQRQESHNKNDEPSSEDFLTEEFLVTEETDEFLETTSAENDVSGSEESTGIAESADIEVNSPETDSAEDDFATLDGLLNDFTDVTQSSLGTANHESESADSDFLLDMKVPETDDIGAELSLNEPTPEGTVQDDETMSFDDLDSLLDDDSEPEFLDSGVSGVETTGLAPVNDAQSDADLEDEEDFDDLERLLEDGDSESASPSAPTRRVAPRTTRRSAPAREQNMRVPVKHLDNLSNLVGELVVNRNTLERDQERLRQFLDNLLFQVQQLNDVGQRMRDLYERSLLESSLVSNRKAYAAGNSQNQSEPENHATGATFDALEMDRFTGFHTLSQEMIELIVRVRESSSDIGYTVESSDQVTRQFRQVTTQLQEGLNTARMVAFSQAADRLPRAVRDISLKCGKEARLIVDGKDTLIDKMIVEHLYDPLTHLVNNAITHGIETPEERKAAGKQPEGSITVQAFYQGNQTVIYVADDGGGINPAFVQRKAVEKKLITQAEADKLSDIETYDLLFHAGFSTRDQADDFAGRGVGMDVVRTSLAEIRGVITIDSEQGKGTSFTIRLPLTLSISKALSCVSNQARIAFPMDGVEDMLDVSRDRIVKNEQGDDCVKWRDRILPFQAVTDLLKFNRALGRGRVYGGSQDDDVLSIIVLRSANTFVALQVDQVIGEEEIVIKQLEGPVPKPLGIAGATILGDGRVMPIADVIELIDIAMGRVRREPSSLLWAEAAEAAETDVTAKTDPTVLIVDDSITVRELLSMSFNKVGYRVEQARDGQEAWDKLRSGLPCDLVFCDIEMPRMDGLELLSRMQKDNHLKHVPIAMLTSRGADRHRQMAVDLGASGYFTKPYLEEALLDAAQRMLNGETLAKGRGG